MSGMLSAVKRWAINFISSIIVFNFQILKAILTLIIIRNYHSYKRSTELFFHAALLMITLIQSFFDLMCHGFQRFCRINDPAGILLIPVVILLRFQTVQSLFI